MNKTTSKSYKEAYAIMTSTMKGEYSTSELVRFLMGQDVSRLPKETFNAYIDAIRESSVYQINTRMFDKPVVDLAGTGGDGKHTANISTLAALLCASTGLVAVAKYGNRAASGICGSMDLLEALGIPIDLTKAQVEKQLQRFGFAPLYARAIYPGGRFVAEARTIVGKRTILNLLFPLARPVVGKHAFVFGFAYEKELQYVIPLYKGKKDIQCVLVHGLDGTDEISIADSGKTVYVYIHDGKVTEGVIDCQSFGIAPVDLSLVQVTSKPESMTLFAAALARASNKQIAAIQDAAIINAAVALFIALDPEGRSLNEAKKYIPLLRQQIISGNLLAFVKRITGSKL